MTPLLLNDATLIDGTGSDPQPHVSVLCESGRIAKAGAAGSIAAPDGARVIDCGGMTLMPGMTDAHVHFGLTARGESDPPESHVSYVLKVVENIRIALDEGFTTVRDAGGLDPAYAAAVEEGQIIGPRILPSGSFLSQTGGHGDHRSRWSDVAPPSIPGLVAHTEICDGVDEVRRAARTQIRRGVTQVKLMASGGVMSPNDPIESLQFTVEEMAAAVHEAHAFGKYVMAHCHTPGAMRNALDAGVRSIEHGSMMTESIARRMAEREAYLVPTIVILELLARVTDLPAFGQQKLETVRGELAGSVAMAREAGVRIGSGSDLLGPRQRRRGGELVEKAKHLGAMGAIVSATKTNAALLRMEDRIGTAEEGKDADLVVVAGDPLANIALVADAANVVLVVKGGEVVKDALSGR
ncbi:MAG: amidohydrolase family protein [Chloroflexi bacterium]|nr:amidohydrolase family protein [Chloroflexota bacterium]